MHQSMIFEKQSRARFAASKDRKAGSVYLGHSEARPWRREPKGQFPCSGSNPLRRFHDVTPNKTTTTSTTTKKARHAKEVRYAMVTWPEIGTRRGALCTNYTQLGISKIQRELEHGTAQSTPNYTRRRRRRLSTPVQLDSRSSYGHPP